MPVKAVDEGLDGGFVDVTDVGCRLSRFLTHYDAVGVDETERVDYDLALDGLDGVYHHCDGSGLEGFEELGEESLKALS